ncbi:L-seryl-tRNA(Sec) selenium transferase [Stackebrandtia endophytica]|uniref:L-seryl-tRNA(Sec) selenium transferase n=1 Tax=Stackebrandtia endophytica TaxID=1496996 RepID=A0A543B0X6_9ACTN|nr:L-seryl-tRNA(Sec) selenium transferase [Stackebrandtia endophytica]TQL78478.1 L-seryl-tRNA(Sec) selenium transferase [Stackebrandtia endophytica]
MADVRRNVPRADRVLADARLTEPLARLGRDLVRATLSEVLDDVRHGRLSPESTVETVVRRLPDTATGLRAVVNATGVIVHTNLGRAPLSPAARDAVVAAAGYTDVEFDLATGQRAGRGRSTIAALAREVPEAPAVHVTNNNAAALLLAATVLAQGRDIVISRGELVEIGDRFRLPDLLACTGARLREVGTTNRTHFDDYAEAVDENTAFILSVHPSNFFQTGFTATVPIEQLVTLPVPVVHDIGSGLLHPHPRLPDEPDVTSSLRAGAALVTASADKLLGGPQAGLLFGERDLIERLRRHPMARALRVDKLTLAALEATVTGPTSPVAAALRADVSTLAERARLLAEGLIDAGVSAEVVTSQARVGGGGAPEVTLPSVAVAVDATLAEPLRIGGPAVVGRTHQGRLLLDLRTVPDSADATLRDAVVAASRR